MSAVALFAVCAGYGGKEQARNSEALGGATLARKAGVEKATVDECLCHIGDFKVTDIYLERDWDLLDRANRRVLALFRWGGFQNREE